MKVKSLYFTITYTFLGLPRWLRQLRVCLQCRRPSLSQGDPLEKEMATYSSILAGESHGRRSVVGYSP